jgi:hypothetical protein
VSWRLKHVVFACDRASFGSLPETCTKISWGGDRIGEVAAHVYREGSCAATLVVYVTMFFSWG